MKFLGVGAVIGVGGKTLLADNPSVIPRIEKITVINSFHEPGIAAASSTALETLIAETNKRLMNDAVASLIHDAGRFDVVIHESMTITRGY